MNPIQREDRFDMLYRIISDPRFLQKEGLGNEVPYFIETYDIREQAVVYRKLDALVKRLEARGLQVLLFGLYDFVIEYFKASGDLDDLFAMETQISKQKFYTEMVKMLSLENVTIPEIERRARDIGADLVILCQVGEVYPYMRAHELLSALQPKLSDRPVIVFFPGSYTSNYNQGFQLSLFGIQTARYYRAFKLDDYLARGNL